MKRSIYAWCVLNPKAPAGMRWRVFRNRRSAREAIRSNGGKLFQIVRVR